MALFFGEGARRFAQQAVRWVCSLVDRRPVRRELCCGNVQHRLSVQLCLDIVVFVLGVLCAEHVKHKWRSASSDGCAFSGQNDTAVRGRFARRRELTMVIMLLNTSRWVTGHLPTKLLAQVSRRRVAKYSANLLGVGFTCESFFRTRHVF